MCGDCQGTELCCSQRVPLTRDEGLRLRRLGAHIGRRGRGWLMNPKEEVCAFYEGGKCSIYEARPRVCKTWSCCAEGRDNWIAVEELIRDGVVVSV